MGLFAGYLGLYCKFLLFFLASCMCVFFVGFDVFLIPSNCAIFIFSPYQINSHSFLLFMKWVICGFLSFSKNCFVLVSFMKIKIT